VKRTTAGSAEGLEATLSGRHYTDPAILEREREQIFSRSWLCAGREADLPEPGDYVTLEIGCESLLLVRGEDRRARAFFNVCRHRGSRLCDSARGTLRGTIRCPYHAWTYGLDGRLAGAPLLKEGGGWRREDFGLRPAGLESWSGFLFVRLDERGPSFREQMGAIIDRVRYPLASLRTGGRTEHVVRANWKLLVENYQECYHCPGVHPELCAIVPLYRSGEVDSPGGDKAYFRDGAYTFTLSGTSRRPILSGLEGEDRRRYNGELVLPNMFLNLFPDYAHTRVLWPLAPDRTRIVSEWLFEATTVARPDFDSRDAVDFLTLVGWQDWKVCEGVQRGVESRSFGSGVYAPQERYAAEFKHWYLDRMAEGAGR
jgi:Rieske 2Fe-2S family protein